ncbi:MAG: tRNA (adenosine(37)-N6)-dimethylallyltransferase MiaA [Acutalibacteraceae bacterium]|nr:tRNA (adenosine(37)-N6)-dimethylallyltransferase MiaA [Acutalibacteraceae bacterium]
MSKIKTVFIVGPTASGKTGLGISLAEKFSGEIVSADSMQIYKGIHIASAAPDIAEMRGIPHHLLEFLEPSVSYSVADYVKAARGVIADIEKRGNLPIAVGGTGLYISSLADNTEYTDEETDYALRKALENRFDQIGAEEMLKELSEFDPDTAARLHPNNRRRIIRAFEVYKTTGKTVTEQNELSRKGEEHIEPLLIGINYRDREKLYERINLRVDIMLKNGLLEEAKTALGENGGAVQAIGHKELAGFLKGECTLNEAAEKLKRQTRRYAKRQLTWFNRDKRINWIYADETADAVKEASGLIKEFLEREETK